MKRQELKILSLERKLEKQKEASKRKERRLIKRALLGHGKAKEQSIKKLKAELRRVTHKIVRFRYKDCYSCDKFFPYEERQAGHYHTDGGNPGTRYDFNNLRTQCAPCNFHKGGDAHYGARLLEEIGQEGITQLDKIRKINPGWKPQDYQKLIEERKKILNSLEQ